MQPIYYLYFTLTLLSMTDGTGSDIFFAVIIFVPIIVVVALLICGMRMLFKWADKSNKK